MELINWFLGCINDILIYCSKHAWAGFLCIVFLIAGPYFIYTVFKMRAFDIDLKSKSDVYNQIDRQRKLISVVEATCEQYNEVVRSVSSYELSKPGRVDGLYNELHDDLVVIFGDDYKKLFPLPGIRVKDVFNAPSNNNMWAAHLLLAHKGLVKNGVNIWGWDIGGIDDVEMNIAMLHRIEYHIKKQHPEYGNAFDICIEGRELEHNEVPPDGFAVSNHKSVCGSHARFRCSIEYYDHVAVKIE